jgi:hypothetical protein
MNFAAPQSPNERYFRQLMRSMQSKKSISLPGRGGAYQSYQLDEPGRAEYMRDIESSIKGGKYERGQGPNSPALIWTTNRSLSQAAMVFDRARSQWSEQMAQLLLTGQQQKKQWGGLAGMGAGALAGSYFGPYGAAIGAGIGAAGGSIAGESM